MISFKSLLHFPNQIFITILNLNIITYMIRNKRNMFKVFLTFTILPGWMEHNILETQWMYAFHDLIFPAVD